MSDMVSRIRGGVYGHLLGDALGVPYEFQPSGRIPKPVEWKGGGTYNQPVGTWSDDGALMLCHVASFTQKSQFDPKDTADKFVRWVDDGYQAAGNLVFEPG